MPKGTRYRERLKLLFGAVLLPVSWRRPVVTTVVLPAHAELSNCSSQSELDFHRFHWGLEGTETYIMETEVWCFPCRKNGVRLRVGVEKDKVVSVVEVSSGEAVDSGTTGVETVKSLFNSIQRAIDNPPYKCKVEYDAKGYFPKIVSKGADPDLITDATSTNIIYSVLR